ncbi:MAG: hypothetical protein JO353_02180 [Phycisphaerae bacterium]|nr:hypothetical protein [Phycisphaerae bacterium]
MSDQISIEQVEALAHAINEEAASRRQKLARLISAEARILAGREPKIFAPRAIEFGDVPDSDSSYPPDQEYRNHSGPRLIKFVDREIEHVPQSGDFYHAFKIVTTNGGLYVDMKGQFWISNMSGEGYFGQFPAYPGNRHVSATIEFDRISLDDIEIADLVEAEAKLRALAFPLATAA